ncbi:hypothetical protein [Streptomyces sp. NPDC006668]
MPTADDGTRAAALKHKSGASLSKDIQSTLNCAQREGSSLW